MSSVIDRPRLIDVEPLVDKKLKLIYNNGEIRIFDVKPYIERGHLFAHLKDDALFKKVRVKSSYVSFDERTDFAPGTVYDESEPFRADS